MKIVCDNCSAKYQISDEKVRNKVFKIRCKKCSHVIVVRADQQDSGFDAPADEPAPASEDATRVADYPEDQGPAADAIWYVVINREQVGPLTRRQVEGHFDAGDIDADTFTWAEGMGDWIRLAAVPEFAHLAPSAPDQPASTSFEAAPRPAPSGGGGGGVFAGLDDGDDVMVSNNQNQTARAESLFGNEQEEEFSHSPRVSGGQSLRNQRNENSVLFSLDSLAGEVERSPRVSNTGGSEGSGLIDISALAGGGASRAPDLAVSDDAFGGGAPAFAPVSAAPVGAPMPTFVTQRKSNVGKIAALVAGLLIVLGGAIFGTMHFMKDSGGGQQQAVAANAPSTAPDRVEVASDAPAKPAAAPEVVKPVAEAPKPEAKPEEAPAAAADEKGTAEAKPEEAPADKPEVAKAPDNRPAAAKPRARADRRPAAPSRAPVREEDAPPAAPPPVAARPPAEARPAPRPSKKSSGGEVDDLLGALDGNSGGQRRPQGGQPAVAAAPPAGTPALPDKLSRTQILTVVKQNAGAIAACKDREPGVSGTVMVKMVIASGGNVSSADVVTGQFKGSPVGNCVEGKVRAFRFPQFAGDPMQINMPFSL